MRCSFIPALRLRAASSENAFAVMAKIGTVSESGRSSARIFSAASKPFITGIMMSIKMRSYVPGADALNFSRPSAPFHAFVTLAPLSSSRNAAISMFTSLSSTSSTCSPRNTVVSISSSGFSASNAAGSSFSGISVMNVVPTPFSLTTVTVPPMASTSFFTMERPSPVP